MRLCVLAVACLALTNTFAAAGKLGSFEREATRSAEETDEDRHSHGSSCLTDIVGDILVQIFAEMVVHGSTASVERDRAHPDDVEEAEDDGDLCRVPGDPLLPRARLDVARRWVESDVEAWDFAALAGYGPFALRYSQSRYRERAPRDTLDLIRVHALCRLSLGNHVELDLAPGALIIDGDETQAGFAFALPLLIRPLSHTAVELRPAWASVNGSSIGDYDVGLLLTWGYASLRAGYRWVLSGSESLSGPYAGVAVHY